MTTNSRLHLALLRGINVGGNKKVPMAELRSLAEGLGWQQVATYIQSGNLLFAATGKPASFEAALERTLAKHFGFEVPVIVRAAAAWLAAAAGSPFADAERERPNLLHRGCSKSKPAAAAAKSLAAYCTHGERVVVRGDTIWIDYREGVARSKVSPAVLDRAVGSTVTLRNWKSVQAIAALLRGAAS